MLTHHPGSPAQGSFTLAALSCHGWLVGDFISAVYMSISCTVRLSSSVSAHPEASSAHTRTGADVNQPFGQHAPVQHFGPGPGVQVMQVLKTRQDKRLHLFQPAWMIRRLIHRLQLRC